MRLVRVALAVIYTLTLRCERLDLLRTNKPRAEWTRGERFGERLHTSMCRSCRRTRRKLARLDEGLRALGETAGEAMPEASRERLRERLRDLS